jgi:hypothetical protein
MSLTSSALDHAIRAAVNRRAAEPRRKIFVGP